MRVRDAVVTALENLSEHKLRSALTMLGMMFGVGAVIAMLAIGAGAEQEALSIIDRMGVRNVVIRAKDMDPAKLEELRKKSLGLSMRDVEAIGEAIPRIEVIAPKLVLEPYQVLSGTGKTESQVYGVSQHHAALTNLEIDEGRFIDAADERAHAQVCVLGASSRRELFGAEPALGRHVKVDDVWLEVIGVLAPEAMSGASVGGVSLSSTARQIFVPFTTGLRKFEHKPLASPLDEIVLRLEPEASPHDTAAFLRTLFDRLHGGVDDYELIVPEALLEQSQETQRLFNLVMGAIAGIALVVGGIGIMNIMLASVLEQTREIGVRRAVGALRRDIRFQFLVTSFTISFLGGLAGITMGVAIARVVAAYAGWPTVVTFGSIAVSTGVSVFVGLVSGLYPAIHASRLEPIDALRHE